MDTNDPILDPHRLLQFVTVAEHLNITHAAAELHLTQQAVSSTIKTLERDLGVSLFERSGRRILLTDAGRALLDGAQSLLDASYAVVRSTRAAGRGTGEHLVIAHTPAISSDEVFDLTSSIRRSHPGASITARQCFPNELVPALRAGTIDVALRRGAVTPGDVAAAVIAYTPLRIAVSAAHRLADRTTVSLVELKDDELVLWGPPGESFYADFLLSICRRAGFEPRIFINRIQGTAPTTAVIDTGFFAFVTADPGLHHHRQTVVLEIAGDQPFAPVQALWLRHTKSRLRQALLLAQGAVDAGPAHDVNRG